MSFFPSASIKAFASWICGNRTERRSGRVRLGIDVLEDRTVPSAQLLGFSALTGDWVTGTLDSDQLVNVISAQWDPYNLVARTTFASLQKGTPVANSAIR